MRSASGMNSDVMKMAAIALLIRIIHILKYVCQTKFFLLFSARAAQDC